MIAPPKGAVPANSNSISPITAPITARPPAKFLDQGQHKDAREADRSRRTDGSEECQRDHQPAVMDSATSKPGGKARCEHSEIPVLTAKVDGSFANERH